MWTRFGRHGSETLPYEVRYDAFPGARGFACGPVYGWSTYLALREETDAAGHHVYLTYDNGDLEITPVHPLRERVKMCVHDLIITLCDEARIDLEPMGSTTYAREAIAKGIEADNCYFIAQVTAARDAQFDAVRGPVPDLAIEIDVTQHSVPREPIYAALGVAELWRYRGGELAFCELRAGRYEPIEHSNAFPFLTAADLKFFISNVDTMPYPQNQDEFRQWVRSKQ